MLTVAGKALHLLHTDISCTGYIGTLGKVFNVSGILNLHFSNVPREIKFGPKVRGNNETGSSLHAMLRKNHLLASNEL